jgi:hypothetical protein
MAVALAALVPSARPVGAQTQTAKPPSKPGARGRPASPPAPGSTTPVAARFRLVLNFAAMPGSLSYDDVRTPVEYAERSSYHTRYEAGTGIGFDAALQVSLFRGLGLLGGYSRVTRDTTGTLEVSRPHPLYLNRPRATSAELSGYGYTEGALDLDLAYARSAGHLDWALFAGVTLFQVEADLLDVPTFDERYPYDELQVVSTPARAHDESATGWNAGGRLDYRFGGSGRFGAGIQLRYSSASLELKANQDATAASLDVGGFSVAAGVRLYF